MRLVDTPSGPTLMNHYCKRCGKIMPDQYFDLSFCDPCRSPAYHEAVARLATRGVPMMMKELGRVCAKIGPGIHRNQKVTAQ